jgi:hypothetical protein
VDADQFIEPEMSSSDAEPLGMSPCLQSHRSEPGMGRPVVLSDCYGYAPSQAGSRVRQIQDPAAT